MIPQTGDGEVEAAEMNLYPAQLFLINLEDVLLKIDNLQIWYNF